MIGAALLALAALAQTHSAGEEPYAWPIDLPRVLTSSFAEYRPGRFHAGIDLRTGGIGVPVHSARDGHVTRVRCSPWGYGKAVYVLFDNGTSAVYAHLDDYNDALRAYVREEQHKAQSYTVDLYPEGKRFPVKRGDLIAYSGETGIGAPHLHYELRDASGQPVNPRKLGLTWPDNRAPVIDKVAVIPADPDALAEGGLAPVVRPVTRGEDGRLRCAPVRARGALGFGALVSDPGEGGYTLGVYELHAMAKGQPFFTMRHDRLSYDNNKNGAVAYHPLLASQGRFLLAYRWPGNVCESYAQTPGDGLLPVGAEPVEVTLRAVDFFGNAVEVLVPIVPDTTPEPAPPAAGANTAGRLNVEYRGGFLDFEVSFNGAETETPVLRMAMPSGTLDHPFRRKNDQTFFLAVEPAQGGTHRFEVRHPRVTNGARDIEVFLRGQGRRAALGKLSVEVPDKAPYGMLALRAYEASESRPSSMRRHGKVYTVWPSNAPLDESITLRLPAPAGIEHPARAHIYRVSGSGWARLDTTRSGAWFEAKSGTLGSFAILEDATAPTIANIQPAEGAAAASRRPKIEAVIADNGSGVDKIDVRLNGKWLLFGYDPEHARIYWSRDEDLPPGTQTLQFRVTDAAGNIATQERTLIIPAS